MKKIFTAAVIALALTSCGNSADNKTAAADSEVAEAVESAQPADVLAPSGKVNSLADDALLKADTKTANLVILDFNATWCGPCKQFGPTFESAAAKYDNVTFVSVDIDVNPETAASFGVQAVPTVVFMLPDGTRQTYVGTEDILPEAKFFELVDNALAK